MELVAEVFVVGESAIYYDNNMMVLDEYRIVVAFSVQNLLARRILPCVVANGIVGTRGIPLVKFGTKLI